jgi:hypothetical protein
MAPGQAGHDGTRAVHRAPFADDLLLVLDSETGEPAWLPLAVVARGLNRYKFTAAPAPEGGLWQCNYPHPSRPGDYRPGDLQHELDATWGHADAITFQLHCRTACWTCHDQRTRREILDLLASAHPVPVPSDVIAGRTGYGLSKGHYGARLLDQLAGAGEIEEAAAPGAGSRLWRLSARSVDYAESRAALSPGKAAAGSTSAGASRRTEIN